MAKVHGALAPGMLIAAPPLGDPNFDRTVVLLAVHGAEGALGFVVNRAAPVALGELLAMAGYGDGGLSDTSPVYIGGPVQPSSGWIVCDDDALSTHESGVIPVGDRVRVTSSKAAFDALVKDLGEQDAALRRGEDLHTKRRMVMLGYSGWGPGQLEGEIAAGAWLPVPLSEEILFEVSIGQKWERAYALLGLSPVNLMNMRSIGEA